MADKILLMGAQFFGHHGVDDDEQRVGAHYVVDVELERDLSRAGASDDLADTVSYAQVYQTVREIVEGKPCRLIETLADKVAHAVLSRYGVESVTVCVKKQPPPISGVVDYAGVQITRNRR
ncbi:MAG: dihydroneopterin aldolase [Chloroflexi bacterium]|nr:dihydroneopterin aldolase [Chloroflexota bacterium]